MLGPAAKLKWSTGVLCTGSSKFGEPELPATSAADEATSDGEGEEREPLAPVGEVEYSRSRKGNRRPLLPLSVARACLCVCGVLRRGVHVRELLLARAGFPLTAVAEDGHVHRSCMQGGGQGGWEDQPPAEGTRQVPARARAAG